MDLFTLVARLGMDTSEYDSKIGSARKSFSGMADAVSAKAVAMGAMVAHGLEKAASMVVDLGKSAVTAAAEVAAEQAQFTATFGELQGSAEKAFDRIGKSTGIFSTRLQNVGTKAFSQFKGAGLDAVDALGSMETYTNLAADAAAHYDISLEEADEKLRSFLRGNTEAGDAIGLFTSESQRNTYAMEKYGAKWTALTEAQKQMLMLDVAQDIYEQSGAIGQAARESDNWTNVVGNLKEVWRQTLAVVGKPVMVTLTPILKNVTEWLQDEQVQLKLEQFGITVANKIDDFFEWVLNPTFPTWEEIENLSANTLEGIRKGLDTAINWTLGKFGLPDAETIVTSVSTWWSGQGNNAYERVKSVLSWTLGEFVEPATETVTEKMGTWWEDTGRPSVQGILDWTIGELFLPAWIDLVFGIHNWWENDIKPGIKRIADWEIGDVQWPTWGEIAESASAWWSPIKSALSEIFTINVKASMGDYSYTPEGAIGTPEEGIDVMTSPSMRTPSNATVYSNAVGLDYVPYNNYLTRLHEGEAVLTKAEATDWRRGGTGGAVINEASLASTIAAAVADALGGAFVNMDGERVGQVVLPTVSRGIAQGARSKRYATV